MKNVSQLFETYLRGRDLRLTTQRAEILRAIFATHRHVTAEELYEMLRADQQTRKLRISRATVYRTLALLAEGGFIETLDLGRDGGTLYEHVLGHEHHDHMVCTRCGRIIEFHDDELEALQDRIVKRHEFTAESHRLNIYGMCQRCAQKSGDASASAVAEAPPPPPDDGAEAPAP